MMCNLKFKLNQTMLSFFHVKCMLKHLLYFYFILVYFFYFLSTSPCVPFVLSVLFLFPSSIRLKPQTVNIVVYRSVKIFYNFTIKNALVFFETSQTPTKVMFWKHEDDLCVCMQRRFSLTHYIVWFYFLLNKQHRELK